MKPEQICVALEFGGSLSTATAENLRTNAAFVLDYAVQDNGNLLDLIIAAIAPTLEIISISESVGDALKRADFPALRALKIDHFDDANDLEQLLERCNNTLREVRLCCTKVHYWHVQSIALRCTSLKVLDLSGADFALNSEPIWEELQGFECMYRI